MRKQKGITLISLIVSIIAMSIVLGILASIVQSFSSNMNLVQENGRYVSEITKFNSYFIDDVKNNKTVDITEKNIVIFEDGTTYQFAENSIYRNKVKICSHIATCTFDSNSIISGGITKNIIVATMVTEGNEKTSVGIQNEYVLRYW